MKTFFLFYLLSRFTGNPLLALIILLAIYVFVDKAYLGLLPDFTAPLRRSQHQKALLQTLAVNPANADAAQELGEIYFKQKKYAKALTYLKQAAQKVQFSAQLYLYLGMAYIEAQQPQPGKEFLEKAIELDSRVGYGLPYIYLLKFELNLPQPDDATLRQLEEKLEHYANTENYYRMGMIYKQLGNSNRANYMFDQALDAYSYVPPTMRRIHRRWALLARWQKLI